MAREVDYRVGIVVSDPVFSLPSGGRSKGEEKGGRSREWCSQEHTCVTWGRGCRFEDSIKEGRGVCRGNMWGTTSKRVRISCQVTLLSGIRTLVRVPGTPSLKV